MSHAAHPTDRVSESLRAGVRFCFSRSDLSSSSARDGDPVAVTDSVDRTGVMCAEGVAGALLVGDREGTCSKLIKLSNIDFLLNCLKTGKLLKVVQVAHRFSETFRKRFRTSHPQDSVMAIP